MSDTPEREPITSGRDDEQIAEVMAGHDHNSTPPARSFKADRRVVIAISVAVACFSLATLVALVTNYLTAASQRSTIADQGEVITAQGKTIDVERSRSVQAERQLADLQSQVNDQQNQTLCRAQIANDYERLSTQLTLLDREQDRYTRAAIIAALNSDRDGFQAELNQASSLDGAIADLGPKVDAAAQARQESVATCQKAAASTTTTTTASGG